MWSLKPITVTANFSFAPLQLKKIPPFFAKMGTSMDVHFGRKGGGEGSIFYFLRYFKPKPKLEWVRKISCKPQFTMTFASTLYDKNWPNYGNFEISLLFDMVTSLMMSRVCNTYFAQQISLPIFLQNTVCGAPVAHSEITRTNIVTNKHTNTQGENIITSLSRVIGGR